MQAHSFTDILKIYAVAEWFTFLTLLATYTPLAAVTSAEGRRVLVRHAAAAWSELQGLL